MLTSLIVLLMVAAAPSRGRFVLQPGAFLKLPGATDNYALNTGAATKAAYDPQEHFLYVVGKDFVFRFVQTLSVSQSISQPVS